MIHICFGLHDKTGRYAKFTGTAILSCFENTTENVTAHILHDNTFSDDNREKFSYLAGRYSQHVKFYNVEKLCADEIAEIRKCIPAVKTSWSTIGAFFRLMIPKVLPADIEKCIYLDSDMLVNLDISELWRVDLADKPLAAVPELEAGYASYKYYEAPKKYLLTAGLVAYEDYFNSGLLLMNLNYLRNAAEMIMDGVKWRGDHPQCNSFDQDTLNYLFANNYLKLPVKFDRFIHTERALKRNQIERAIYHYTHPHLKLDMNDPFNRLWLEYFVQTPFFEAKTIGRINYGFQNMHEVKLKQAMIRVSALMSGKERAFFIPSDNIPLFRKVFAIRDDEEIITAANSESLNNLIDAMNKSRGRKIFFIVVSNFSAQALVEAGFKPGTDFINGLDFLPKKRAQEDTYPIVQIM